MGWLAPYSDLWPTTAQMRGQGFLPGAILSCHMTVGGGTLLGETQPLALDAYRIVDCLGTCIIDFYTEHITVYQGMFTLCWGYYCPYACIPGRVTITDSDRTGPRTQVYVVRCTWSSAVVPYFRQVMSASIPGPSQVGVREGQAGWS
jgi:hypothetical protein